MNTCVLRRTTATLLYVMLLLGYFLVAVSPLASLRQGTRGLPSFWHLANALSVYLGAIAFAWWSDNATRLCRLAGKSRGRILRIHLLEQSFRLTVILAILVGILIFQRTPAFMQRWYEHAHQELTRIQGPALLACGWAFYVLYCLLIQAAIRDYWQGKTDQGD